ncbi:hypothetical protein PPYR_09762 [Photinus pyralis]|uniref:HAT C-terminal dimerisation domain-containing protein n=2 Tax=Photinus pyralis TaxID=7054 RepID=A0A5N4AEG0_PHOPY|nr:hypothetical protein PPYR_09762 [Photinus pyralis]
MDKEIGWNELKDLGDSLNLPINEDKLYEDYCLLREVREMVAGKTKRVDLRWVYFFEKCVDECGLEIKKLVSFVLSISIANAAAERVFSVINEIWTKNLIVLAKLMLSLKYRCVQISNIRVKIFIILLFPNKRHCKLLEVSRNITLKM